MKKTLSILFLTLFTALGAWAQERTVTLTANDFYDTYMWEERFVVNGVVFNRDRESNIDANPDLGINFMGHSENSFSISMEDGSLITRVVFRGEMVNFYGDGWRIDFEDMDPGSMGGDERTVTTIWQNDGGERSVSFGPYADRVRSIEVTYLENSGEAEERIFPIAVEANGGMVFITVDGRETREAVEGALVQVRPIADEGFKLDDVVVMTVDGKRVDYKRDGDTYYFEMPGEMVIIRVTFTEEPNTPDGPTTTETVTLTANDFYDTWEERFVVKGVVFSKEGESDIFANPGFGIDFMGSSDNSFSISMEDGSLITRVVFRGEMVNFYSDGWRIDFEDMDPENMGGYERNMTAIWQNDEGARSVSFGPHAMEIQSIEVTYLVKSEEPEVKFFPIEVEAKGGIAIITVDGQDTREAAEGALVQVRPIADEGFKLDDVVVMTVDGNKVECERYGETYVFMMPGMPVIIEVTFNETEPDEPTFVYDQDYSIKVVDVENGKAFILVNGQQTNNAKEDDVVTVMCQPNLGYTVSALSILNGDAEVDYAMEDENIFSFIMPDNDVTIIPVAEAMTTYTDADGVVWSFQVIDDETCQLGDGTSACIPTTTAGTVTVPSYIYGRRVAIIADNAFSGCSALTGILLPDENSYQARVARAMAIKAGRRAYDTTGFTIGNGAFKGCSKLTSINIPASVSNIMDNVFEGCLVLKDVYFEGGEAPQMSGNTFSGMNNLNIYVPENAGKNYQQLSDAGNVQAVATYEIVLPQTDINGNRVNANVLKAAENSTVTLTVTPADGFSLKSIAAYDGSSNITLSGNQETRTFTMPGKPVSISAEFNEIGYAVKSIGSNMAKAANLVVLSQGNNPVNVMETLLENVGGNEVLITVTPQEGYRVKSIDVRKAHSADAIDVTMNNYQAGSKAYTAKFQMPDDAGVTIDVNYEVIPVAVNIKEAENGSATASCNGQSIDGKRIEAADLEGKVVTLTISPASGYILQTLNVVQKSGSDFIAVTTSDATYHATAAAYTATFTMPANAVIANMLFAAGTPSGIDIVTASKKSGAAVNLNGQKVMNGYKGIVIENGHKVVRK